LSLRDAIADSVLSHMSLPNVESGLRSEL
jgi:hypothetical protein